MSRSRSGEHFWNVFNAANPVWAQMASGLQPEQAVEVQRIIDGMLREQGGGEPGATVHTEINIGVGTKRK